MVSWVSVCCEFLGEWSRKLTTDGCGFVNRQQLKRWWMGTKDVIECFEEFACV